MCYRRHGHNEGDNPMFTQPIMYKNITNKNAIADLYAKKLIQEGVVSEEWVQVCNQVMIPLLSCVLEFKSKHKDVFMKSKILTTKQPRVLSLPTEQQI